MSPFHHPRYSVLGQLGRGAQGVVFEVRDHEAPERRLSAKLLPAGEADLALLAGEFALLSRLRLPGLVRAYDFARDEATGRPFLVEDLVEGPDASQWVAALAPGPERSRRIAALLVDVAVTLDGLHRAGFTHGDLKPAHVRVAPDGRTTLLDLGAAVRRGDVQRAFTPGFAAPELLAGAPGSPASDLYALGALGFHLCCERLPAQPGEAPRRSAGWVSPRLADVITSLLSEHPADRPSVAELLRSLGSDDSERRAAASQAAGLSASQREAWSRLWRAEGGVRYLAGASGSGKSHLVRELVTRALLGGRSARLCEWPLDRELFGRLLSFLRGEEAACPFARQREGPPLLVVIDDVERAPPELGSALEAFRCRGEVSGLDVIAVVERAPPRAPALELAPLSDEQALELCRDLGATDPQQLSEVVRAAAGNLAWVAAALGRVPLVRGAALARARDLPEAERLLLSTIALAGGALPSAVVERLLDRHAQAAIAGLGAAGLIQRAAGGARVELSHPELGRALGDALGGFEPADRLADALLDSDLDLDPQLLLRVAGAAQPPARRVELLREAARRARLLNLRGAEADALLGLGADPALRERDLILSLDRVTRGGGSAGLHPEVLSWLHEAAERDVTLRPLSLRRRSEQAARSGDTERAVELAREARHAAEELGDLEQAVLARATEGSAALYRADWELAEQAFKSALASAGLVSDAEELARLEHNRGVVALYRDDNHEACGAFEHSLELKRKLGDQPGVWACLLNLGIARTHAGDGAGARRALEEALRITDSLVQPMGRAWCLAALADLDVRDGDRGAAERSVAEIEHAGVELPAALQADVQLLRAQIALLAGDASAARRALGALDPELRAADALVDSRALTLEARALTTALPADRRGACRAALRAARRARAAGLPEAERNALKELALARGRPLRALDSASRGTANPTPVEARYAADMDAATWQWLEKLGAGAPGHSLLPELGRRILKESGAERVFLVQLSARREVERALGFDLDGHELGEAAARLDRAALGELDPQATLSYQPEREQRGSTGSLLVANGKAALVLAEHRFKPHAFDQVSEDQARGWATLLAVALRLDGAAEATSSARHEQVAEPRQPARRAEPESTVLPTRGRARSFPEIAGSSASLERALLRLDAAADSDLPVLIVGETGVGKELFARAVHDHSRRAAEHFVAVSCGAIPDALFEAELFGHTRGSFTGADRARPGLLARAEGGTLFLDEIGELPLLRQAALLRALATRRYRPVGGDDERDFDVRIVAATNRDLPAEVAEGQFRQDLLYRLNVLEIRVPALREREDDMIRLSRLFLERAGSRAKLTREAEQALGSYSWPGNVRELEHCMQRLAAAGGSSIGVEQLPREIRGAPAKRKRKLSVESERVEVERALSAAGGNITRAAESLGLTRHGLKKRMLRLGLRASGGN